MRRRAIQVEVVFLYIFAVVAFAVGQAKETFLQDRVLPIPQRQSEAETLLVVGNASQTVFSPAIRAGARLIMCEVIPGVTTFAIVLTYRSPLPFTEIGPPFFPGTFFSRASSSRFCSGFKRHLAVHVMVLRSYFFAGAELLDYRRLSNLPDGET